MYLGSVAEVTWGPNCRGCRGGVGLGATILKKTGVHLGWAAEATWGSRCRGLWGVSVSFFLSDVGGAKGEEEKRNGSFFEFYLKGGE